MATAAASLSLDSFRRYELENFASQTHHCKDTQLTALKIFGKMGTVCFFREPKEDKFFVGFCLGTKKTVILDSKMNSTNKEEENCEIFKTEVEDFCNKHDEFAEVVLTKAAESILKSKEDQLNIIKNKVNILFPKNVELAIRDHHDDNSKEQGCYVIIFTEMSFRIVKDPRFSFGSRVTINKDDKISYNYSLYDSPDQFMDRNQYWMAPTKKLEKKENKKS